MQTIIKTLKGDVAFKDNEVCELVKVTENLNKELWLSLQPKKIQDEFYENEIDRLEIDDSDIADYVYLGGQYFTYFDILYVITPNFSIFVSIFSKDDIEVEVGFIELTKKDGKVDITEYFAENLEVGKILNDILKASTLGEKISLHKIEFIAENFVSDKYDLEGEITIMKN